MMKLPHNLCAHYLNLDFSEKFLSDTDAYIRIQSPYPIHKPLKDSKIDIISKFHDDLKSCNNQLTTLRREFPLVKDRLKIFNDSYATITKGMHDFYMNKKHESPFVCDYNPYYGMGFLEYFQINGDDVLVRPDSQNNLCVTKIRKPWKSHKLRTECQIDESITGISSHNNSGVTFLLLKREEEVNLVKIFDIKNMEIIWNKKFKRGILDTKFNTDRIGIITSSTKFRLYDTETNKKINLETFNNLDSAHRFEFIDVNTIAILNEKSLKVLDLRSNDHKHFQSESNDCNFLCSMKIVDDFVYLGSRHHLIRTDIRFIKNVEFCTHLMKYSPCYMDLIDNFLCLSSQNFKEKVLFNGNPINSLPMSIPSTCETLNKYGLKNDVSLREEITERLQKSVGGIKFITENDEIFLYTANSLGDLFKQKVNSDLRSDEIVSTEHLHKWILALPNEVRPLHLTHVLNLRDVKNSLNKSIQKKKLYKFTRESTKANSFLNRFENMYHKDNLGQLGANFASIWHEDKDEEERDVNLISEAATSSAALDKVSSWMESNNYFFD